MAKLSGGFNNYYLVEVKHPQRENQEPYMAECEDIIQALGMTFDEGCAFKALWRNAAARMGNGKPGNESVYDMEKLVHYGTRLLKKSLLSIQAEPNGLNRSFVGWYDHTYKVFKGKYPTGLLPHDRVNVRTIGGETIEGLLVSELWWGDVGPVHSINAWQWTNPEVKHESN